MEDSQTKEGGVDVEGLVKRDRPIITEPDIVMIYDTRTGEASKFRVYSQELLRRKLTQKREDGSIVFSLTKPNITPKRGSLRCILHPDDPNRAHYDGMGFPVCKKSNLLNPHQRKQHLKHRHPQEWETLEAERVEKERQEDRELRNTLVKKVASQD